jgi:hypothetical protein
MALTPRDYKDIAGFAVTVDQSFKGLLNAKAQLERLVIDNKYAEAFYRLYGQKTQTFQEILSDEAIQTALNTIQEHPEWLIAVGYSLPQDEL